MVVIKDKDIFFRKGENNKTFQKIVNTVIVAARKAPAKSLDMRLLQVLRKFDLNYQGNDVKIFHKREYAIDIYNAKQKIAIEIEKAEIKNLWKDFCKLAIGARRGLIGYGILMVPTIYHGKRNVNSSPHTRPFDEAKRISKFISDFLWNKNLAIIGYSAR